MAVEVWKDIEGYEGLYQVSDQGRVKSLNYKHTGKEKILNTWKTFDGYLYVDFYKDKQRKHFKIHTLVAKAFIPIPECLKHLIGQYHKSGKPMLEINHINENHKDDNSVKNLQWCEASYNVNYGTRNERVAKALSIPILQYTTGGIFIREWESTRKAERELGLRGHSITSCLKGRLKSAGGYLWIYK